MLPQRFQKLKQALCARQHDLTVLMDNVKKPHNMAAILRSCEAIGIHRAHIITSGRLQFNKPKAAAGVLRWIELEKHKRLTTAYQQFRQSGFRIIAAHPSASATHFREYDYTRPTVIVMGTERTGLTQAAIDGADELITIPMHGLVQSLNVSVSAALILYEAQRQREQKGLYCEARLDSNSKTDMNTLFEWAWPRVAAYCRRNKLPYPELDPDSGQIVDMQQLKK